LRWLYNANQDFTKEMERSNTLNDLHAHSHLKGKIFKRKAMDPSRLQGLGYFGFAGAAYMYFPYLAA